MNIFRFCFLVCMLIENLSSLEFDTLSCTIHESCRCNGTVLNCFLMDTNFILPTHISPDETVDTVSISGGNYSVAIPVMDFNKSWSAIKYLEIFGSRNNLTLRGSLTRALTNLEILRIRNSNLSAIEMSAFSYMSQIVEIDLSNNSFLDIKEIENGLHNFNSTDLKIFNISGIHNAENMRHFTLSRDLFFPLSAIEVLDISWTRAFSLSASFGLMPNLISLNISGTFIIGPSSCFSTLLKLNNLEVIAIDHWPTLARNGEVPALSYNHYIVRREPVSCSPVSYIENSTGCMIIPSKIKHIYMRYVQSSSFFLNVEKGFCVTNNSIELFSVQQMKISEPVNAMYGFHKLKLLDMSYLGIYVRTNILEDMPDLEIYLSPGNKLDQIETDPNFGELFKNNKKLKRVDLSENDLSFIPLEMFANNPFLESVNLARNLLVYFKLNLSSNFNIKTINLNHNNLKTIDAMIRQHLDVVAKRKESSVELFLAKNDWVCNCDSIKFITWMQITKVNINRTSLVCKDSYSVIRQIAELDLEQLQKTCFPENSNAVVYITIGIVSTVAVAAMVVGALWVYYRRKCCFKDNNRQDIRVVVNVADNVSLKNVTLEEVRPSDLADTFVLLARGLTFKNNRRPRYSVFLAYCHDDRDFVIRKLYSALENCLREYLPDKNKETLTLLYDKNFLPGEDISDICKAAVYESYVTVAVVSNNFLRSSWCSYEMQTAVEAEIPIIPLYLNICQEEQLRGILKFIYDRKVRLLWPQNTSHTEDLSEEELELIRSLATSVTAYVRKFDSEICKL